MQDLSLNILDITDNSIKAMANLIEINVVVSGNILTIEVKDNGKGMSKEFLKNVTDPYVTTRKTRNVGLGIPFFKMQAELSGGTFYIDSTEGKGTVIRATFEVDNIDRPPIGNLSDTICALLPAFETIDMIFNLKVNENHFVFDTKELKENLDGVSVAEPFVIKFVKDFLEENIKTVLGGVIL